MKEYQHLIGKIIIATAIIVAAIIIAGCYRIEQEQISNVVWGI